MSHNLRFFGFQLRKSLGVISRQDRLVLELRKSFRLKHHLRNFNGDDVWDIFFESLETPWRIRWNHDGSWSLYHILLGFVRDHENRDACLDDLALRVFKEPL